MISGLIEDIMGGKFKKSNESHDSQPVVIIGAGRTGRGFIARLAAEAGREIVFIDKSEQLVNRINQAGEYTVHFFDPRRFPVKITNVTAYVIGTKEAIQAASKASITFTAVGEQNLPLLADFLNQVVVHRTKLHQNETFQIITAENGTSPGTTLMNALQVSEGEGKRISVSEAAIFCSTVEADDLDILSESYDELPYDPKPMRDFQGFAGMVPVEDFPSLLLRKIYTYNCISACIAYLGAFKGYQVYADAANDSDIVVLLDQIIGPLNLALSKKLNISEEEQTRFAARALAKFSDYSIRDDVARNARDVARKLAPNDRLIAPAILIEETGGDIEALALVMAASLHYGKRNESELAGWLEKNGAAVTFTSISKLPINSSLTILVAKFYKLLTNIEEPEAIRFSEIVKKG